MSNTIKSRTGSLNIDRNNDGSSELEINANGATFSENVIASSNLISNTELMIQGKQSYSYQSVSSDTTLSNKSMVIVDTSGGDVTVTLPSAASHNGKVYTIKMTSTANKMQLNGGGSNIDSDASLDYSGNLASVQVISNGTQWYFLYESHPGTDPAPWTPADTTTDIWLDASDSTTMTLSSPDVTEWRSKSGSLHFEQNTAANKPHLNAGSLNGLDTITLDGTDDYFICDPATGFGSLSTISVFMVEKCRTGTSNDDQIIGTLGWSASSLHLNFRDGDRKWSNPSVAVWSNSTPHDTWHVMSYVDDNTDLNVHVTGDSGTTGSSGVTYDLDPFSFGAWESPANTWQRYTPMDVAEIIIVKSAVSDSIRQKMEGYLAHKWGLTASLPSGHPYKSSGPTK